MCRCNVFVQENTVLVSRICQIRVPERKDLGGANLQGADLIEANLEGANLKGASLEGAHGLSFDQLSKVKTLHGAKLDDELLIPLKKKYPALFNVSD